MSRTETIRDLVRGALPNDINNWDIDARPGSKAYDVMTDRQLTETEQEAVTMTANLLPDESIFYAPIEKIGSAPHPVSATGAEQSSNADEDIAREYRVRGGTGRLLEDNVSVAREEALDSPEADEYWIAVIAPRIAEGTHQGIFRYLR